MILIRVLVVVLVVVVVGFSVSLWCTHGECGNHALGMKQGHRFNQSICWHETEPAHVPTSTRHRELDCFYTNKHFAIHAWVFIYTVQGLRVSGVLVCVLEACRTWIATRLVTGTFVHGEPGTESVGTLLVFSGWIIRVDQRGLVQYLGTFV